MKKVISIDGKNLHIVFGKTKQEWEQVYGNLNETEDASLWDVSFEELADGTLEINEDIWYWYIDGRCYETLEYC